MLFTFCFSTTCFANPIVVSPFGNLFTAKTGNALLINLIVDFIVLLAGYLIIGQAKGLLALRFVPYLGLVVIGGIVIDVVSDIPPALLSHLCPSVIIELDSLMFFLSAGLFLYLYNGFLSKKFQDLEGNQARVIGVVMGILTNPMIGEMFFRSIQGLR